MNQEKIGKLIAKLRKEKELTQSQLGDKVGVGYRSVSKWERGINLPDISIINKLSEILGISSDELLKGELNEIKGNNNDKTSKHSNKTIFLLIIPIIIIISLILVIIKVNTNKTYIYKLETTDSDYYVEGDVTFKNEEISININKIKFYDKDFAKTIIQNYQYAIYSNNNFIVGYGYTSLTDELVSYSSINDFTNTFTINYTGDLPINKLNIVKNKLLLKIDFLDKNENEITKEIAISLISNK